MSEEKAQAKRVELLAEAMFYTFNSENTSTEKYKANYENQYKGHAEKLLKQLEKRELCVEETHLGEIERLEKELNGLKKVA